MALKTKDLYPLQRHTTGRNLSHNLWHLTGLDVHCRSERLTRAQWYCQLVGPFSFYFRTFLVVSPKTLGVYRIFVPSGLSWILLRTGTSKCLTVAFDSRKYSFPCTPCWSSKFNCESIFLSSMCSMALQSRGRLFSFILGDLCLTTLSMQLVAACHTLKTLHKMSAS